MAGNFQAAKPQTARLTSRLTGPHQAVVRQTLPNTPAR